MGEIEGLLKDKDQAKALDKQPVGQEASLNALQSPEGQPHDTTNDEQSDDKATCVEAPGKTHSTYLFSLFKGALLSEVMIKGDAYLGR